MRHLLDAKVPSVPMRSTTGQRVDLSRLAEPIVVYIFVRTGRPGVENPHGWDLIAGGSRVHAASVLLPRPLCRTESTWGYRFVWALDARS